MLQSRMFGEKPFETAAAPQRVKLCVSLASCSTFSKNRVLTLGEEHRKSKRFARDVLQFGAFCNTSREIARFCIFATPLGPECKKTRRGPSKLQNMLEFSPKCPTHPFQKSEQGKLHLKQLFEKSTPTLRQNTIFVGLPVAIFRMFWYLGDTSSERRKGPHESRHRYPPRGQK